MVIPVASALIVRRDIVWVEAALIIMGTRLWFARARRGQDRINP